ncbi:MAG: alpha/beta fold hydrolase [Sandaracinaceae bacterium]|nr:alpha/beta fold hydrolase [Sandaracinaceae bacterium]
MTTALLVALAVLAALAVASWLHYVYWVRRLTLELPYELLERVPTEDGCAVELRRLPREGGTTEGVPVLLVHGLALNHRNNDLTEDLSLGRYLARRGRDVWLLTLRSGRDDLGLMEERRATFEAMARHDLPAGIDAVLARTGAERLDYVGFSMGGMLMYAAAGRGVPDGRLRRVVIIGSPAEIRPPLAMLSRVAGLVPGWIVPTLRLRLVSRFMAFAAELVRTPIHRWIYETDNVERGVAGYALVNGFVNIPSGLARDLVRFASYGGAIRLEGVPVLPGLHARSAPALFVAGAADRLAPPDTVRLAFDAWGADAGAPKAMRVVGIEQGAAADYGHGDLAIGRFAEEDVFAPVHEFLAEHDASVRAPG